MTVRCAIYTRKSADERADAQLGTIENQRDLCGKYIASQAAEGWTALTDHYDDPGYSGGTIRRPALTRLMADIEAGRIDVVAVYKIDRLTRSLRDFVGLVDRFERRGVTFVAITQAFDTRSSMGRLILNVLLSFAQFERELTSERLKDWFAGARARGLWQGPSPYGYQVCKTVLSVDEDQAYFVRYMFRRYPALGSCTQLAEEVSRMGAVNQRGRPFDYSQVRRILRNKLYLGQLPHRGEYLPGTHPPLITERVWRRTQALMDESVRRRRPLLRIPPENILKDMLHDRNGAPMIHLVCRRRDHCFRYYTPSRRRYGRGTSPDDRYRAAEIERAVLDVVERIGCAPTPDDRPGWLTGALRRLIARVDLRESDMLVTLHTGASFVAPVCGRIATTARTRGSNALSRSARGSVHQPTIAQSASDADGQRAGGSGDKAARPAASDEPSARRLPR